MKKITITSAKIKANKAFSKYIRTRDALKTTGDISRLLCITCDKCYPAFGNPCAQAGHFIQGRHSATLYDERNAHGQCYNCNVTLKSNPLKYYRKMEKMYGEEVIKELEELDKTNPHLKIFHYQEIEQKFIDKLKTFKIYEL